MRPGHPARGTRSPRFAEGGDWLGELRTCPALGDHPVEDPRGDDAGGPLELLAVATLLFEQLTEGGGQREDPPFGVLSGAGVEPHLSAFEIHLPPLAAAVIRFGHLTGWRIPPDTLRSYRDASSV